MIPMIRRARLLTLLAGLALVGAGCNSNNNIDNGPTTPTPSTPVNLTTDTFTGTVNVGGNDTHTFVIAQTGTLNVTLTQVGPPATVTMGLGVGQPVGGVCQLISNGQFQAGSVAQISGTAAAGTYCVLVYDVGNLVAPVTYTLSVVHS